ncbi:MAG: hypothetical protein WBS54_00175 [Acidobacteriota bacterium]
MGEGYTVRCTACGWSRSDLMTGVGWVYSDLENVLDAIEPPWRGEVRALLKEGRVLTNNLGHALHRCPGCGDISSHFVVDLALKGGGSFHTRFHCTLCGTELVHTSPGELKRAPCPACGRKALTSEETMLWD